MANILNFLIVLFAMLSPGEKPVLLVSCRDWTDFNTKQRQGTAYEVLFPALGYEKVVVKVRDTAPAITPEQVEALTHAGTPPMVTFTGFKGKLYQDYRSPNREVKLSATADGIIWEEGKK